MANLLRLPIELLFLIHDSLACARDSSCLTRCCRALYWLLSDKLFDEAFARRLRNPKDASVLFHKIFAYAVELDSRNLLNWLASKEFRSQMTGQQFLPLQENAALYCRYVDKYSINKIMPMISYLHYAALNDAPHVVAELVKLGAYVHDLFSHPDLEPLCLDLSQYRSFADLNGPLHIACSYALPRTTLYLLKRGADPNYLGRFGLAPFHTVIYSPQARRISRTEKPDDVHPDIYWEQSLLRTVATILDFGGDPNLKTETARRHVCGPGCWRSPDCGHRGQTCLHLACGAGIKSVVELLLEHGADPDVRDEAGHLPLYYSMAQGHESMALWLLRRHQTPNPGSLILAESSQSTSLHIAARFGALSIVQFLRRSSNDLHTCDKSGKTPLDEAMTQRAPELQQDIALIVHLFQQYMANSLRTANSGPTKRAIGSRKKACARIIVDADLPFDLFDHSVYSPPEQERNAVPEFESDPPLSAHSVISHKDVLMAYHSSWFDEDKRKELTVKMSDHEMLDSGQQSPFNNQASEGQFACVGRTNVAAEIGSDSVSETPSARFWKTYSQTLHDVGGGTTDARAQQSSAIEKGKRRKWKRLQW